MTTQKKIQKSVEQTDRFLSRREKLHIRRVEQSLEKLQGNILDSVNKLATSDGKLAGLKVNLAQMNRLQRDIVNAFEDDFSSSMKRTIKDMRDVSDIVNKSYAGLGVSAAFTGIDKEAMSTLLDGYYNTYANMGGQYQEKVIQSVYNNVLSNGRFSDLVYQIQGALLGTNAKGVRGVPLANYAKLYARDMLMNYHQEVNLMKAEKAELKHFLYVGNIIETTRDFCAARVGKYFTLEEINQWNDMQWAGKSGPPMTHRGGWNCRHHWQAIKPEWVDIEKGERLDIGDWDLEQRSREPIELSFKATKKLKQKEVNPYLMTTNQDEEKYENLKKKIKDHNMVTVFQKGVNGQEYHTLNRIVDLQLIDEQMEDIKNRFPKLYDFLQEQKRTSLRLTNSHSAYSISKREFNPTAVGLADRNMISIGTKGLTKQHTLNYAYDDSRKQHFWNHQQGRKFEVSGEDLASTFRHELGHRIEFAIPKESRTTYNFDKYKRIQTLLEESIEYGPPEKQFVNFQKVYEVFEEHKHSITNYGKTNSMEFFAESMAIFTSPKYESGMLHKDIEDLFKNFK